MDDNWRVQSHSHAIPRGHGCPSPTIASVDFRAHGAPTVIVNG